MSSALAAILVALSASVALVQVSDVKGSNDHPMVSRDAGSIVIGYDFRKFDEFVIPLAPLERLDAVKNIHEPSKSQRVEGRATRILYVGPPDRSPLEIVRRAPVGPNDNEDGRAKNRRVALLKQ